MQQNSAPGRRPQTALTYDEMLAKLPESNCRWNSGMEN